MIFEEQTKNTRLGPGNMGNTLQSNPVPTSEYQRMIRVFVRDELYELEGEFDIATNKFSDRLPLAEQCSFEYIISIGGSTYALHKGDIEEFEHLRNGSAGATTVHYSLRILNEKRQVTLLAGHGHLRSLNIGQTRDQRLSEQQIKRQNLMFTKVFEPSSNMMEIVTPQSGDSGYINTMLLEKLHYPVEDIKRIISEKRLLDLIHPDDLRLYENFIKQLYSSVGDDTLEVQLRWRGYTNAWRWFKTRAHPFEGSNDDTPLTFLAYSQEITQQKVAEEEKKNYQLIKEEVKARTAFFSNVSHEFRTPLTLLLAPLQDIITRKNLPPPEMEKVQFAYRNSLRLQKLVNSLLDFTRIESAKLTGVFKPTNLAAYTTDLVSNFRTLIEHAGLKLKINCALIDEPLYINQEMYEKIIFNLVSNAFKFTFKGKIEVTLKDNKNHVKLMVRDTGVGIESANLEKIFERFVRIEGTRARTVEGSGIGLALVKELVNVHRGTIKVASVAGEGTTFTITFLKGKNHLPPRSVFESVTRQADNLLATSFLEEAKGWTVGLKGVEDQRKRSGGKNIQGKPRVIIVDDNADMRTYLKNMLEENYSVSVAENGKAALELISPQHLPDLILSDLMMPEEDGKALLRAIKNNEVTRRIPVILLTAKAGEESLIDGLTVGADDYLTKPFSARELLARIDARIQISKMQEQIQSLLHNKNVMLEQSLKEKSDNLRDANTQLSRKNKELESLSADLSTFAFVASHDLREPLRKIRLFTHVLTDREPELLSDKGRDMLKKYQLLQSE